jgi:hypothetical protein
MQAGDSTAVCTEQAVSFINKSLAHSNTCVVFWSAVRAFCWYVLVSLSQVLLPFSFLQHCCAQALGSSGHTSDSYSEGPSSNLGRDTDYPELRFPPSLQAKRLKGAHRGSRGIAPLIHNVDTRCGWLTSLPGRFTTGKEPQYPLRSRMGGPKGCLGLGVLEDQKIFRPLWNKRLLF